MTQQDYDATIKVRVECHTGFEGWADRGGFTSEQKAWAWIESLPKDVQSKYRIVRIPFERWYLG